MFKRKLSLIALIALLTMPFTNIQATNISEIENSLYMPTGEWVFGVSFGYGKLLNPLNKQDDIPLYLLPDIRYYGEKFSIENLDISYNLYQRKNLIIEVIGQQNIDGLYFPGENRSFVASLTGIPSFGQQIEDDIVEPELPEPDKRSLSYMAGVELRYYSDVNFLLSTTTDVSNVHNGQEVKASLHKSFNLQSLVVELETGVTFKSKDLTHYYYNTELPTGVFEENIYETESALNYHLKVDLTYIYNKNWYLVSTFKSEWLDDTIYNSPVVVKDKVQSFFVGVKYVH